MEQVHCSCQHHGVIVGYVIKRRESLDNIRRLTHFSGPWGSNSTERRCVSVTHEHKKPGWLSLPHVNLIMLGVLVTVVVVYVVLVHSYAAPRVICFHRHRNRQAANMTFCYYKQCPLNENTLAWLVQNNVTDFTVWLCCFISTNLYSFIRCRCQMKRISSSSSGEKLLHRIF